MTADRSASATKSAAPLRAVVGIGSSGGGIEAMEQLFAALPNDLGAAFVVVQHIGGDASEVQADVIARFSPYPVRRLTEAAIEPEANHVYVVPPQSEVRFNEGLAVVEELDLRRRAAVIDRTFQALAEIEGHSVVGIVLSGTGSDGTLGLKAISDRGGLTLAQTPETSKYEGMPLSAADSGHADYVLPPQRMAEELLAYLDYLSSRNSQSDEDTQHSSIESILPRICDVLLEVTEHDFRHYKSKTLIRRVSRRMQILRERSADDYLKRLQQDREEVHALFRELLISVTAFFRDPDTFSALANLVIPQLFEQRKEDQPIRMWVPGCATGQEAYTLAMLMREELDKHTGDVEVQIFATDIDERALNVARAGTYPASISNELTEHRLERFFKRAGKQLTVVKEIRDMCIFSTHNLISDPPYSQMDLISCRNLLIYLGQHLQQKLIPLFHFVLKPNGYLLLGPSENLSSHSEIFRAIDKKHRISQRKPGPVRSQELFTGRSPLRSLSAPNIEHDASPTDVYGVAQRIVLDEFAPRYAVVNEDAHLICTSTGLERYFEFPHGPFMNNVVKMAKTGLRSGLRAAFQESRESIETVKRDDLTLKEGDSILRVEVTVQPMPQLGDEGNLFMIVFRDLGTTEQRTTSRSTELATDAEAMIEQLEQELNRTRNDLENAVQDLESSNEELKSSNEELRSINEELQSTNEELETSKEEIQAGNEALAKSNSDLENLLQSTRIATIFLDEEYRIRSFTPAATDVYGLIDTDVGRPLDQLKPLTVEMPPLPEINRINTNQPIEDVLRTSDGKSFVRRVRPYHQYDGTQDGIVVTFTDITKLQNALHRLQRRERQSAILAELGRAAVSVNDLQVLFDLSVAKVSQALDNEFAKILELLPQKKEFLLRSGIGWQDGLVGHLRVDTGSHSQAGFTLQSTEPVIVRDLRSEERFSGPQLLTDHGVISGMSVVIGPKHDPWGILGTHSTVDRKFTKHDVDFLQAVAHILYEAIQRKKAERTLSDRERQLKLITDALPVLIAFCDCDMTYRFANAQYEEWFGLKSEDIIGKHLSHVIGEQAFERIRPSVEKVLQGEHITMEQMLPYRHGPKRHVHVEYVPHITDGGEIEGYFAMIEDVSDRVKADQARAHLSVIVESSSDAILSKDLQGTITSWNAAAERMYGYTAEQTIGQNVRMLVPPDREHEIIEILERIKRGESTVALETLRQRQDGTLFNIMLTVSPMRDVSGEITGASVIAHDISKRIETEQRLRENELELRDREGRLRALIEASSQIVWSTPPHGEVVDDSPSWREFTGQTYEAWRGTGWLDAIHPDDQQVTMDIWQQALQNKTPVSFEYRIKHVSGEWRWTSVRAVPQIAADGTVIRWVGMNTDITAAKQAEIELLQSEERLHLAAEAAEFGTYDVDLLTGESFWSAEMREILHFPLDEPVPTAPGDVPDFVHPKDRRRVKQELRDANNPFGSGEINCELRIITPNGQTRWILMRGTTLFEEEGEIRRPVRAIGIVMDIDERKRLEIALKASERRAQKASLAKSEFLANMSHEIRTPMTSVMGYTDILVSQENDPQKSEYLRTIKRNSQFLLDIINDILDLSKIEAGKLEVTTEPVNLVEVIGDIRSLMQVRADEKQLEFHVEFEGPLPARIETDPKRLRQILINLLGNAIKFTETGSVRLVIRYLPNEEEPNLQFDIIDTGVGVSDEHASELFQPFVQADASITRNYGGTGLGLTISRRLAHLLGGEVIVESELGQGSTFSVTIQANSMGSDLIEPSIEGNDPDQLFDPSEHSLQGTVLVVDDRRDVRFLARHLLTGAGLTVEMAEDGLEAIAMVEQREAPFDLILLDMRMPHLDGYSTAARLRELGVEQPIIALTADALEDDQQLCLDQGCNVVLRKPIDPRQLLQTVSQWLNDGPDPSPQHSTDRHRVLVIDDSQDTCRLTKLLLETEGYQVEVAHRCEQAVHVAKDFLPHTILLDHGLPDADGFETIAQLREIPGLADSRFIAVTGRSEAQESLDAGFDEHLTKPTDLDELLRAIRGNV
ncbi:MAG: PAS domain S-box protein [Planctomycetaceae bacterium]